MPDDLICLILLVKLKLSVLRKLISRLLFGFIAVFFLFFNGCLNRIVDTPIACVLLEDKTYAFIDTKGEKLFTAAFPTQFNEGLGVFQKDGKCGYIDASGETVIEARFDRALDFTEGRAAVKTGNEWAFIDKTGKTIASGFESVRPMSEGLAAVKKIDEKWSFIDASGKTVIPSLFFSALTFSDGRAAVNGTQKFWGCSGDDRGSNGYAADTTGFSLTGWGYINRKSQFLISPSPDFESVAERYNEGLAWAVNKEMKLGFINKKGEWAIPATYPLTRGADLRTFVFKNGIAPVIGLDKNGEPRWGFIDAKGRVKIPYKFQFVDMHGFLTHKRILAGLVVAGVPKYGFIDEEGEWVIEPRFEFASGFQEGYAVAKQNGKYGYLKPDGTWLISPRYPGALPFHLPAKNYFAEKDYRR